MSLPRFSVQNPVAVNLLMALIIVAGAYYGFTLVRELFPNSQPEQISVSIAYPGAAPGDIEKSVTRRLEREIEDVEGIDEIRSAVLEGVSLTIVELDDGVDQDAVLNDIRGEVDKVTPKLPTDAEEPALDLIRPYFPVISLVVYGDVEEARLREAARDLRDELLDLDEVSRVVETGVRKPEIQIEILPEKLEEYGLSFEEVGRSLGNLNLDLPGGVLENRGGNIGVRTVGEESRALDWEDHVVLARPDGSALRLRDLGRVRETFEEKVERGRYAGKPAVLLTVLKTPEEDAIAISDAVKAFIEDRPTRLGEALRLGYVSDLSRFIAQRLDLMLRNAKFGLVLVLIALALFLELRVAFWVAVGLPVSFLGTFILMHFMGASINLISLFALIVVLGLLVDDAIVIGENIFTKLREGMPVKEAAIYGANEVAVPVVAAVTTTIVAFLPLAFIEGNIGTFMRQLPIVVIAALSVSLVEAFLILPAHLAHEPRARRLPAFFATISDRVVAMRSALFETTMPALYERFLRLVLHWRYLSLAVVTCAAMLVVGLVAGGFVPFVFIQESDAETLNIDIEMVAGTPEERTLEVIDRLEKMVMEAPEVGSVFSVLGASFTDRGRQTPADPATVGQITIELLPAEERENRKLRSSDLLLAEWRGRSADIGGVNKLSFVARSGGPQGSDIELRVKGDDFDALRSAVEWIEDELRGYRGVHELQDDLDLGKLEVRIALRDDARELGLSTRDVASQVRHALFGFEIQELQTELEEVKVRALLPEAARRNISDLAALKIVTPEGKRVPIQEVARLETQRGYATLARVDGDRAFTIKAEVDDAKANVNDVTNKLVEAMTGIEHRFPGVSVSFEGVKKQTTESFGSLKWGFPAALLMIYMIIAILFRSYVQPVIVMLAIPFAFIGAIFGHWVTGNPFTILSMIGSVALAGIVVNDSLILVDFTNRARRLGASAFEAVVAGGRSRLRAILLTSITTICGLAPLMLERSFQAKFMIPMAVAIVFGLAFATVLTLFILPCAYCVFEDVVRIVTGRRMIGEGEGEDLPEEARKLF